jgi:hypothetical protein
MTLKPKWLHRLVISILFSLLNWMIIYHLLIELPFWKYFFIELLLMFSMKFYIFTTQKLELYEYSRSGSTGDV